MTVQIGELAKRTAYLVQTVRYYEREGLLPPPERNSENFRPYDEWYTERLQFILHCRSLDIPLNNVWALLYYHEQPREDCGTVNTLLDKHIHEIEQYVEALMALKCHLHALRESCLDNRATEVYGILQGLSDASYGCDADVTRQGWHTAHGLLFRFFTPIISQKPPARLQGGRGRLLLRNINYSHSHLR